ncbi:MAG: methyltransferase family protein [Candidatus Thorarchaeota archaeon]
MSDIQYIAKKSIGVILVLVYMNALFIIFKPEVFTALETLLPIALLSAVICIDVAIRPISGHRDRYNRVIVSLAFLLFPFMVALPYYEWHYLTMMYIPNSQIFMVSTGIMLLLIGSFILLVSRVQIGQYGGGKITIEDNHKLITNGMYKHIRNPQYLGFILLFTGYSLSFSSLIVTVVTLLGLFSVFRSRLLLEEKLLLGVFGEEYVEYKRRTWRLIPRIY